MLPPVSPRTLDHVALWVADRDRIADFVTQSLGMHVIDKTDAFTLVGSDARRGKLTLFSAEGPRERGALRHIGLRVRDLDEARRVFGVADGQAELPDGVVLRFVGGPTDTDFDLDHVALFSRNPAGTAEAYLGLGFERAE